jgi:hypothetical protein
MTEDDTQGPDGEGNRRDHEHEVDAEIEADADSGFDSDTDADPDADPEPEPDLDELRARVAALDAANEALRAYGEAHDLPVIERSATRIDGTIATLRQNVPGTPTGTEE